MLLISLQLFSIHKYIWNGLHCNTRIYSMKYQIKSKIHFIHRAKNQNHIASEGFTNPYSEWHPTDIRKQRRAMIQWKPGYDGPDSSICEGGACCSSEGCLNEKRREGGACGEARGGEARGGGARWVGGGARGGKSYRERNAVREMTNSNTIRTRLI